MSMSVICPRPVRDIAFGPTNIKASVQTVRDTAASSQTGNAVIGIFGGAGITHPPAQKMIASSIRTGFAVLGAVALLSGASPLVTATLGALLSAPATVIVMGSAAAVYGLTSIIAALASGSFQALATGLILLGAGWYVLEHHDAKEINIGVLEKFIVQPAVDKHTKAVLQYFTKQ
ncbi:MAG: hypothetical protein H0X51_00045 [Parachlamydiaceae bacterium]|nr:hypothetical protein [Parachlamydiaceae bacterium]